MHPVRQLGWHTEVTRRRRVPIGCVQAVSEASGRSTGRTVAQQTEQGAVATSAVVPSSTASEPDTDPIELVMRRQLTDDAELYLRDYTSHGSSIVVYLSTPITTGPRLLKWLAEQRAAGMPVESAPNGELVRDEVIAENLQRLPQLRTKITELFPDAAVIDPSTLTVPEWGQSDYHRFWVEVIRRCVDVIIFADGWELSTGCTIEYSAALELGLPTLDSSGSAISHTTAAQMLRRAATQLQVADRDTTVALAAAERADRISEMPYKDAQLAALAEVHNVASFVSFTPYEPVIRHAVLPGRRLYRGAGLDAAVERLLAMSSAGTVNVRTFRPRVTKGNPFHYGLTSADEVTRQVRAFATEGYHCIVNETIDIHDGGVSGVTLGGIAEFAPDDTPRAVESGDTARLPQPLAQHIISGVYGQGAKIPWDESRRLEFSLHPGPVGQRREPVIVWESEPTDPVVLSTYVSWPNRFSRLIGDKTYGLMIADGLGLPVPATTVIARRVAPFTFGKPTGSGEWWMRTAPASQAPGRFTTTRGWTDPFQVLAKEDPDGRIAAVLAQEGVTAEYSGATMPTKAPDGHLIEGVSGAGDNFMLGSQNVNELPSEVIARVRTVLAQLEAKLGSGIRIEWAADAHAVWVLQLHRTHMRGAPGVFNPGTAEIWLPFDPTRGLEALSELIEEARSRGAGIEVTKSIGLTSHVGDLLRKAQVPGRLSPSVAGPETS